MPEAKLAIVGASVRAAAESAVRAGFEVVAADLFADADLCALCEAERVKDYPEALAEWLIHQSVDGWLYTGALENYPELVGRMAEQKPLLGNQEVALRRIRDPLFLQQSLLDAGFSFPRTMKFSAVKSEQDWLAKTYRNSNGAGVWRVRDQSDLERAQEVDAYAQQYVQGKPMSASYAVGSEKSVFVGVTKQLVGERDVHAPEWGYCGSFGPIEIPQALGQELQQLGDVLRREFELSGLVGVDFILADDQLMIVEINPRYTASMEVIEHATGLSIIGLHHACTAGEANLEWQVDRIPSSAKLVLYARCDVTVPETFHAWALKEHALGRMADIPWSGVRIHKGEPVTTLCWDQLGAEDFAASRYDRLIEAEQRLYGT